MNIGMVINSQTGNTLSVAKKLEERLVAAGHDVTLHHLQPIGEVHPGVKDVKFESLPDLDPYDALVFGSQVNAFSLSASMACYMPQVSSVQGKPVALLVTEALPYAIFGGNRAVRHMSGECEAKGANVLGSGIVNWSRKSREKQIVKVVDHLAALFD
jgi:flavodoxin